MNFIEAVKLANKGKKIKRKPWFDIFVISTGSLLRWGGGSLSKFEVTTNDILADDWEIYEIVPYR